MKTVHKGFPRKSKPSSFPKSTMLLCTDVTTLIGPVLFAIVWTIVCDFAGDVFSLFSHLYVCAGSPLSRSICGLVCFFFCFFFVFRNNGRVRVLFQFVRAFFEEIVVKWVFYLI